MKHIKPIAFSLGAIAAIAVLGVGCAVPWLNKAKPEPVVIPTSTVQTGEVDMADWKLNRVEELGFEVRVPKYWGIGGKQGPKDSDFGPYWSAPNVVGFGRGTTMSEPGATYNVDLRVSVKDIPGKTLEQVELESNFFAKLPEDRRRVTINGFDALIETWPVNTNRVGWGYGDSIIIQSKSQFYFFQISMDASTKENIELGLAEWREILKTFKPIPTK